MHAIRWSGALVHQAESCLGTNDSPLDVEESYSSANSQACCHSCTDNAGRHPVHSAYLIWDPVHNEYVVSHLLA